MEMLEGFSQESKQDAISQALTAAPLDKAGKNERVDISIISLWEDDAGYYARVAVQHTPLPEPQKREEKGPEPVDHKELSDALEHEAEELLALFLPDAAHEYREEDEQAETMKEEPRFAEMHEKIEKDFDKAEHSEDSRSAPDPERKPDFTHIEPHIEGTSEED